MAHVRNQAQNHDTAHLPPTPVTEINLGDAKISSEIVDQARAPLPSSSKPVAKEVCWQEVDEHHVATKDRLIISVAIGEKAQELLTLTGPAMEQYAMKCGAQFAVITEQTQGWWGLEKFRVGTFAREHHRTLFLDADVFVRPSAPDIFDLVPAERVAMYVEMAELEIMQLKKPVTEWAEAMFASQGEALQEFRGFNSGVVLCGATTAHVWTPPREKFVPYHTSEQAWIERNVQAFNLPFHALDWKFNCQHWWGNFEKLVGQGEFVHLAGANHDKRLVLCNQLIAGRI